MRLLASLTTFAFLVACAHTPAAGQADAEAVRSVADSFHKRVRWKDFSGASRLLVPERRAAFDAAREALKDERDLTVSDFELLELRMDADGQRAEVVSRLQWLRLPSLSEHSDTVTTELVKLGRDWFISQQNKGPFADALSEPYVPAAEPSAP